jgi:hypothetical protein
LGPCRASKTSPYLSSMTNVPLGPIVTDSAGQTCLYQAVARAHNLFQVMQTHSNRSTLMISMPTLDIHPFQTRPPAAAVMKAGRYVNRSTTAMDVNTVHANQPVQASLEALANYLPEPLMWPSKSLVAFSQCDPAQTPYRAGPASGKQTSPQPSACLTMMQTNLWWPRTPRVNVGGCHMCVHTHCWIRQGYFDYPCVTRRSSVPPAQGERLTPCARICTSVDNQPCNAQQNKCRCNWPH